MTTQLYMRSCSYICLVSPISRVQTDENVHKRLMARGGLNGNAKMLVCNMIDEVSFRYVGSGAGLIIPAPRRRQNKAQRVQTITRRFAEI